MSGPATPKKWLTDTVAARFRAAPLVPDSAFQGPSEPYPGHWRRFPEPWTDAAVLADALDAALADLPALWRQVVVAHLPDGGIDHQVIAELGLTDDQAGDILARAWAVLRDRLDRAQADGPR